MVFSKNILDVLGVSLSWGNIKLNAICASPYKLSGNHPRLFRPLLLDYVYENVVAMTSVRRALDVNNRQHFWLLFHIRTILQQTCIYYEISMFCVTYVVKRVQLLLNSQFYRLERNDFSY